MDQGNYLECPMTGALRLNLKVENWRPLWYKGCRGREGVEDAALLFIKREREGKVLLDSKA